MKPPIYNENWSQEVLALYQHDMRQYWDKSLSMNDWNQYKNLLDTYLRIPDTDSELKILDVGCAQATLALLLAERGHNVVAVDLRQEFLDYAKLRYEKGNIRFQQGNVLELEISEKFDLIFANQIVEHLVYPFEMIDRLKSLLRPSGRLVLSTPNWAYIKSSLPSFLELGNPDDWQHMQFTADGAGHFFAYKQQELTALFQEAEFSSISSAVFETPIISGHMKFRHLHRFVSYPILKFMDRILLKIPILRDRLAHQLLIVGQL